MRFVPAIVCVALALGALVGSAAADKGKRSLGATWHFQLSGARATVPEEEPNNECPGHQDACADAIDPAAIDPAGDVDWYTFSVAEVGTPITIGTEAGAGGCNDIGDTIVSLMDSTCTATLEIDDDSGPGFYSLIANYIAPYAGRYHVMVQAYSGAATGCYKLFVTCTPPPTGACCLNAGGCDVQYQATCVRDGGLYIGDNTACDPDPCPQPPPNDACDGAIDIDRCSTGVLQGNTSFAADDYELPDGNDCTGYQTNGKDVVYKLTVETDDVAHLAYTQYEADASIYIVTDCADPAGTCVAGVDETIDGEVEELDYTFSSAGDYYLVLDSYDAGTGGPWSLEYTIGCPTQGEACCFPDHHCELLLAEDCATAGGTSMGPDTVCNPNPCNERACCFEDGHCEDLLVENCATAGGNPQAPGAACLSAACPQPPTTGACCLNDLGDCEILSEVDCARAGGTYNGNGSACSEGACPIVPTRSVTWGQLKAKFR